MKKRKVLITAGPTREYWDPVRYLTNASSGEMGICLANVLAKKGMDVTVVLGPSSLTPSARVHLHRVTSALQMHQLVMSKLPSADVFIATAAVSDYRFKSVHSRKVKKTKNSLTLSLVKNPDILWEAGQWKRNKKKKLPLLIGFALETNDIETHAREKLIRKNCDVVIGNSPVSFASKMIKPLWVEKSGRIQPFPRMTKKKLADQVSQWLISTLNS